MLKSNGQNKAHFEFSKLVFTFLFPEPSELATLVLKEESSTQGFQALCRAQVEDQQLLQSLVQQEGTAVAA